MVVVSNTTPIITLSSIGKIDLLKNFFNSVYVAQSVYNEIRAKKAFGYEEIEDDFFQIIKVENSLAVNLLQQDLDIGEAETIVLAKELKADIVLIDENIGPEFNPPVQQNLSGYFEF